MFPTESTCARQVTAVIPRQNFLGKAETMAENVKVAVRVRPFISFLSMFICLKLFETFLKSVVIFFLLVFFLNDIFWR